MLSQRDQAAVEAVTSVIAVRPPGTWRYNVEALHPTCRATSVAVMVPDANVAFAAVTLMASNAGGRPPIRPRARLAAKAMRVHSRRSSTSNCPRAAKMWRISRPVALVVSMFSCSDRRPMPRACKVSTKLAHGSRQTIEPGDDQHITVAGERQGGGKLRPVCSGAAHQFLEHSLAPSGMEGVDLTVSGLQIGRDPRIADQDRKFSQNSSYPRAIETRVSGLSSGTLSQSDRPFTEHPAKVANAARVLNVAGGNWWRLSVLSGGPGPWRARLSNLLLVGAGWFERVKSSRWFCSEAGPLRSRGCQRCASTPADNSQTQTPCDYQDGSGGCMSQ